MEGSPYTLEDVIPGKVEAPCMPEGGVVLEGALYTLEDGIIGKVEAPCMPEGGVVLEGAPYILEDRGGWPCSLSSAHREK